MWEYHHNYALYHRLVYAVTQSGVGYKEAEDINLKYCKRSISYLFFYTSNKKIKKFLKIDPKTFTIIKSNFSTIFLLVFSRSALKKITLLNR